MSKWDAMIGPSISINKALELEDRALRKEALRVQGMSFIYWRLAIRKAKRRLRNAKQYPTTPEQLEQS